MGIDFSAKRLSYEKDELLEQNVPATPLPLFESWIKQAVNENVPEPYAMSLATCGADNVPAVRTLLLREANLLDNGQVGFVFYTNYDSDKGQDLAQNANAGLLFFWHQMERQVRVTGVVKKIPEQKSTAYFNSRPFESQIAAWVSTPQSGVVASRTAMEQRFTELKECYQGKTVPRPDFWGGYELVATQIEFWQGRANRVHDRLLYSFEESATNKWQMQRLLP